MKAVIFAGGRGTRLWPLSRKRSPKQFEKLISGKSTLQLTYDRLLPYFKPEDIYIYTNDSYKDLIKKQLPACPTKNIIGEPEKKDVGPAVALAAGELNQSIPNEPIIILWSDHLVKKNDAFLKAIKASENIIKKEENKIILIGQKSYFPSQNLGWIKFGERIKIKNNTPLNRFKGFKYRPDEKTAREYMSSRQYCWNLGYFVTTPKFLMTAFKRYSPQIYTLVEKIFKEKGDFKFLLEKYYKAMPAISFDNAILDQIDPKSVYVMNVDIGWTDIGAWESLKNALSGNQLENVTLGRVILDDCLDNLVYNYDDNKIVVGIGIDDCVIVNTKDVVLIAKKSSSSKLKKFVEGLEESKFSHLL